MHPSDTARIVICLLPLRWFPLSHIDTPFVSHIDTPFVSHIDTPFVSHIDTPFVSHIDTPFGTVGLCCMLQVRFAERKLVYTYCGIVLIAINPYEAQASLYGRDKVTVGLISLTEPMYSVFCKAVSFCKDAAKCMTRGCCDEHFHFGMRVIMN
jgi:hypothetical protein